MKKYITPLIMLFVFETVAVTLWLTKDNLFYLFNFSYIGISIATGLFLFIRKYKYARRVVQLLVGLYMLVYLGLIRQENMQIEGFWYYLPMSYFSLLRIQCDKDKCISCGKCKRVCPMHVDVTDNSRKRENGTECILCMECVRNCPKNAL